MNSLLCDSRDEALDIAAYAYEFYDDVKPEDMIYFNKRGCKGWFVMLPYFVASNY